MRIVSSVQAIQRLARKSKAKGTPIALVPTMGYLHSGHASLIHRARRAVGKRGLVVASIYVNPAQFGPGEDLARYPRDLARDKIVCRKAGVDLLFLPSDAAMYPGRNAGQYSTYV